MKNAPKGIRLHIGLFGRRNAGKSSLLNAMTRQSVSIVSEVPGTTTDPVEKPMELLPIGPVLFIDTAGIDDIGSLGKMRVQRTHQVFDRTDVGVIVVAAGQWGEFEEKILTELRNRKIPVIVVFNKSDLGSPSEEIIDELCEKKISHLNAIATENSGILDLREALIRNSPEEFLTARGIVGDLIPPGELVVLVVPIDMEAPKGRLILPQVQAMRDILDNDSYCMIVKDRELPDALARLNRPPALVITDSQAFQNVSEITPENVLMTSFSILFARFKGDLGELIRGATAIEKLKPGDRILVAEACSHHPIGDDIGRVKIPDWLQQYVGGKLIFDTVQGHDFPEDLSPYKLAIHCGGCVSNRREMLSRIIRCRKADVPITNYGLTIAYSLGIFQRALKPFPGVSEMFRKPEKAE